MLKMRGGRSFVVRKKADPIATFLIEVVEFNPDQSQFAEVIYTDNPDLKSGDTVLIEKYSGAPITHETQEGFIIEKDDVLAIIE